MAIFHLSAHDRVSRSAGQSSVASAAYVMRAQFTDERTGQVFDFRHLDQPQWIGMFSPKDAPDWTREAANAERFWNALELFEKRKDAQIALPLDIALPFEMSQQQNIWLAQDYIRETFTRNGYVVLAAIHPPDHDERNIHLHLLVSLRKIDAHGFARTKTEQQDNYRNRDAYIENLREKWEHLANRHLERHGIDARIDRRTLQEQGIERQPQTHRGPTKSAVVFLEQDRAARAAAVAEIQKLEAQIIDLDAKRAEHEARAGQGKSSEIAAQKAAPMDDDRKSPANQNNAELDQLEQQQWDGVPSFRPSEPQPGRYDALKPQQPAFSDETIKADRWTAVKSPIPEQADEFLLHEAGFAAFRCYEESARALKDPAIEGEQRRDWQQAREQAAARVQELGGRIGTILLTYDPADPFREELILDTDKAQIVRAWQHPAFSRETIAADPWTAVYLPIPEHTDPELLTHARQIAGDLQRYAEGRGALATPFITLPNNAPEPYAAATARMQELEEAEQLRQRPAEMQGPSAAPEAVVAAKADNFRVLPPNQSRDTVETWIAHQEPAPTNQNNPERVTVVAGQEMPEPPQAAAAPEWPYTIEEAIKRNPWNAVTLDLPADASAELFNTIAGVAQDLRIDAQERAAAATSIEETEYWHELALKADRRFDDALAKFYETAARDGVNPMKPAPEIAPEAAQTPEASAAPTASEQTTRAVAGAQAAAQEQLTADPVAVAPAIPARAASRFLDSIADRLGGFITYLSDFFFPPPAMTPAQAETAAKVADERALAEAAEFEAYRQHHIPGYDPTDHQDSETRKTSERDHDRSREDDLEPD